MKSEDNIVGICKIIGSQNNWLPFFFFPQVDLYRFLDKIGVRIGRVDLLWKDVSSLSDNLLAEKIAETSMVDLAYQILKERGEPLLYLDLLKEIAKLKGFSEEEIEKYIAQLYTDINIDGRFICVGRNLWGLRAWYPTEQATDSAIAANVKDDFDDEYDDELYVDEEEEDFERDLDDLDDLDEDFTDEQDVFDGDLDDDDLVLEDEDEL
jgi:DNA-directed RNA polymerase subunit delta